jgi:hypothetical protein
VFCTAQLSKSLVRDAVFRYQGAMSDDQKIPENKEFSTAAAKSQPVVAQSAGKPQQLTEADHRRLRAAKKLKENLQRRKQQQRARRAGEADDTDGLPAANSSKPAD